MNDRADESIEIGPYRVLGILGEGGMGLVYAAEQRKPISRRVAVKVIKIGMDTKEVLARFDAERQALALLDHPNVAKVLDAGATAEGRPFFAMELVRGVSITRYCDEGRLSVRQRLELLLQACAALQHAHERGIIHRDIKPSNLLVTEVDGRGVVKVIDFGLAKAINQRLTERTLFTEEGRIIGTPEYMSPEQAETSAQDVDARSDVFSLGVVLYELLAGALPFDFKAVRLKGYFEVQRFIREEEPLTPQRRLSTLNSLDEILALRRCRLQELVGSLRNGLDAVTMKAIAKQRRDRYASCDELAADLRRFLAGEPVLARKVGVLRGSFHSLRRFGRRHPTVAPALLLTIAAVGGTWFAMRSEARHPDDADSLAESALSAVKRQGALRDGVQVGVWDYYYESGMPRAHGRYDDDQQVGIWTYYHENGRVEWNGAFDRGGKRTGGWVYYHPDGSLLARGSYVDDREDGVWTFFRSDGAIERTGQFDVGGMSGPWRYDWLGGKPKQEGMCHRGRRVGVWRTWDEAGNAGQRDFGIENGVALVLEVWPGGGRRRAGVIENGKPVGRWTTWHENGAPRFCCTIEQGRVAGVFEGRHASGALIAEGVAEDGEFLQGVLGAAGVPLPIKGPVPVAPQTWIAAEAMAALAPEQALTVLCAEVVSGVDPAAQIMTGHGDPVDPADAVERRPASVQPELSALQRAELDSSVRNYIEDREAPLRHAMQLKLAGIGRLQCVDGSEVELPQLVGKRRVLLVFLRGFLGEVCTHCSAQTAALANARRDLAALNIETFVIYPAAKEAKVAFQEAYSVTFGRDPPPYRVLFDSDLAIARKLGIEGDLVKPTTILIDEAGTVQHVHVGKADRLVAKELVRLIEGIK